MAKSKPHDRKASWGGKAYLTDSSTLLFTNEGRKDRDSSRSEPWRQEVTEGSWRAVLIGLLWLAQSAFL